MPIVWMYKIHDVWMHKIPNVLMHKMTSAQDAWRVKALDAYCVNAQASWRVNAHFRRHPEEFQSCKEVQTEMTGMDLQELNEDIMIQLYGVDYVDVSCDLSFKMLHKLVTSHNSVQLKPVDLRC